LKGNNLMAFESGRRLFAIGLATLAVQPLFGCGPSGAQGSASDPDEPRQRSAGPANRVAMTVYRDPSCGCCEAWAKIARDAGHRVQVVDRGDMPEIKRRHFVPAELASCHTAIVAGYAIEGHVPLSDVARLLAQRPIGTLGIAVPGMPRGSPGMEMPDGSIDPFQVMAFDKAGRISVFS